MNAQLAFLYVLTHAGFVVNIESELKTRAFKVNENQSESESEQPQGTAVVILILVLGVPFLIGSVIASIAMAAGIGDACRGCIGF